MNKPLLDIPVLTNSTYNSLGIAELDTHDSIYQTGPFQRAIFNSPNFLCMATDKDGAIQIFNIGAERMLGYDSVEVINLLSPNDISDPMELITRAKVLSTEFAKPIMPGFEAFTYKANLALDDSHEMTYIRKDGIRFPAIVSVSALRDKTGSIIGYLVVGTDNTVRKQAEEENAKNKENFRLIFDFSQMGMSLTSPDRKILNVNTAFADMLGLTIEELMNLGFAPITHPDDVVRTEECFQRIATGEISSFQLEKRYRHKNGHYIWVDMSTTLIRDSLEKPLYFITSALNITKRKLAEEELKKTSALQTAIFTSANFSSIATDAKGVIQIFNVGAERMLGYEASEVVNKITPANISDPQELIARASELSLELGTTILPGFEALVFKAARGIEDIYELTYVRKDGSRFPAVVSVTALRDTDETIIGYLLIGTDNTIRKQIEEEQKQLGQRLRDQQFYTRSLFEANIDALITTDPSGIITDVNNQMEELTGRTRDELIGVPYKNCFTDQARAETGTKLVLSNKKITNYELIALARDGKETVVSCNATTFYDRDRKLQGMFASARDITERNLLDQQILEKNIELENATHIAEKANLAKSDFLSSMSHELRSPLNAILGFAQLLESESPGPSPTQKQNLDQILQAGWHLLKLIDEILDLAKIESGKVPLSTEPVSLIDVLVECQTMIEPSAQKRDIKLILPPLDNHYFVSADRTRVKKVFINLLSNAIKYNIDHGMVVVKFNAGVGCIHVSIKDTGVGMNEDQMGHLFQSFNRLGKEASDVQGTGIGLVMAKRLIELMGGKIDVESAVGKGSEFWFELPSIDEIKVFEKVDTTKEFPDRILRSGTDIRTILSVEDNPANMKLIEQIVARHPNIHLLTAVTGLSAIEIATTSLPDVILMDINLPDITGFEALKTLRLQPTTAHIPVIAISANAMPRDIKKGLEIGFYRYLTKPINVHEFMDYVEEALDFAQHNSEVVDQEK
jgi:PAS domain S-box-containing protein